MRMRKLRFGLVLFAVICSEMACAQFEAISQPRRTWTPETSIRTRYIAPDADQPDKWPGSGGDAAIVPSMLPPVE